MKKNFLISVVLVMFATGGLFAQISGGVRVGANISNLKYDDGDETEKDDSKFGPLIGLYLTAMLADNVGVQPELYYSSMGSTDSDDSDYKVKLGYISLPILLRYNFSENFHAVLGPQLGFLLSAKYGDSDNDEDIKDDLKGLDFGAALGIGADIGEFNAGVRYVFGFANILDEDDFKIKSSAIQIVLGYRLFGGD